MYSHIEDLVDIFYNMIRAAVYLDWGGFNQQLSNLRDWFYDFAGEIYDAIEDSVNAVWNYITPWVNWLAGWADWVEAQLSSVWSSITSTLNAAKNYAYGLVSDVYTWTSDLFNFVYDFIEQQINLVYAWAAAAVNTAKTYAYDIVNSVWAYIYDYIKPWLDWLAPVMFYVDWLAQTGWYALTQFLAHPLEFILGLFASSLVFWLSFLETAGSMILAFVNEVMTDLYNFWQLYSKDLHEFMFDPGAWILAKIRVLFFDWLFTLLDEVW